MRIMLVIKTFYLILPIQEIKFHCTQSLDPNDAMLRQKNVDNDQAAEKFPRQDTAAPPRKMETKISGGQGPTSGCSAMERNNKSRMPIPERGIVDFTFCPYSISIC